MVSTLVALRYLGEPMPAAGIGLSPWADMEATGQSFTENADKDPMVNREGIHRFAGVLSAGQRPARAAGLSHPRRPQRVAAVAAARGLNRMPGE